MMTRMTRILALLLPLLAAGPAAADYEAGREAYKAGDYATAFDQYLAAAKAGDRRAFGQVAALYLYGRGTEADYQKAWAWFQVAGKHGDRYAGRYRGTAGAQLTADEIEQAKALAKQYEQQYGAKVAEFTESQKKK